jgi:8-oxo-dGTP pyrophosphatase MutT (NUDIX family)
VARELREELGVEASVEAPVAAVTAAVSGRRLRLHACPAILREEPRGSTDHDRLAYLSLGEFLRMPITSAERALLELLAARSIGPRK